MSEITAERADELADELALFPDIRGHTEASAALRKLANLIRVVGPVMPCGCNAVTMRNRWNPELMAREGTGHYLYCGRHEAEHKITPEYLAWRNAK